MNGFWWGFLIAAAIAGLIWGFRGYLSKKVAAAEAKAKDAVSKL